MLHTIRKHHGWARGVGPDVPAYMAHLAQHRVAVVGTCCKHWAVKKHLEATAAGCVVLTNLPNDQYWPYIDGNLVRIPDDISLTELTDLVRYCAAHWDLERQHHFARLAVEHFDYRVEGARIAAALKLRYKEVLA